MRNNNHASRAGFYSRTAVLAASAFFTSSLAGADYTEYRHPALTYQLETQNVSKLLRLVVSGGSQARDLKEFAEILADRLLPSLVPVGFLHQCRCIKDDIFYGRLTEHEYPALVKIKTEQGAAGLEKFVGTFIKTISPKVCPPDYSRILITELASWKQI